MDIKLKCRGTKANATIILRDAVSETRALVYVSADKFLYMAERYGSEWEAISSAIEVEDDAVMAFYMRSGKAA